MTAQPEDALTQRRITRILRDKPQIEYLLGALLSHLLAFSKRACENQTHHPKDQNTSPGTQSREQN
jgi:hypothetical protein